MEICEFPKSLFANTVKSPLEMVGYTENAFFSANTSSTEAGMAVKLDVNNPLPCVVAKIVLSEALKSKSTTTTSLIPLNDCVHSTLVAK